MLALLNLRVIACLALAGLLAFTHFYCYRKGKANVRAEWQLSIAQANTEARALEQQRQRRADEAGRLAATREAGIRAGAAVLRDERDGLRGDLDAIERAGKDSHEAANKSVAALRVVFEQCTREYSALAEVADRHASDALTLEQAWPK